MRDVRCCEACDILQSGRLLSEMTLNVEQMAIDNVFRLILLAGMVLIFPPAIYWRVKSQATGERLDRRQEGVFVMITLRLCGLAAIAALIVFVVHPPTMAWSAVPLPAWLRWTGVPFGVISGILMIWSMAHLGRNLTDTVVTRRDHTLITSGPYRWVRHPFYTSAALAAVANGLVSANVFIFVSGTLAFALLVVRCRKEEEKLVERFGARYVNYARRTGRFLPRMVWPHRA